MQFYHLSNTRIGAILHSLFYLLGFPAFFGEHEEQHTLTIKDLSYDLNPASNTSVSHSNSTEENEEKRCFGPYGCFPKSKGLNLFPNSLEEITPSLCYYSSGGRGGGDAKWCQFVNNETIMKLNPAPGHGSSLVPGANGTPSYWITHGYTENGNRPWIKEMVHELINYDEGADVFVIDWGPGAKPPYNQAVVNVELVAVYVAKFMLELQELYGIDISKAHAIGHSLGAHLFGFIGAHFKSQNESMLGRISGLDPAQPYFENISSDGRLDFSDATFVDVIHTDARPLMDGFDKDGVAFGLGLGIQEAIGHVDFFPNDGKEQPGCKEGVYNAILQEDGSFLYGIRRFLGCDHMRAYEYFSDSISSRNKNPSQNACQFTAYACPSWGDFISAECANFTSTNRMGFHAFKPALVTEEQDGPHTMTPVKYYLVTASKAPFCRHHYIATINLEEEANPRLNSDLHLVLQSSGGESSVLSIDWTELRGKNLTYKYLREGHYFTKNDKISKVIFRPAMSNPLQWFVNRMAPKTPDLTIKSISIIHLEDIHDESSGETLFCPESNGSRSFSISDKNPSVILKSVEDRNYC